MRSYENKRQHQAFIINENEEIVETEYYESIAPSQFLLEQLDNPHQVKRSQVFKKNGILKLNDWKNNLAKWLDKGYLCGDTIEKVGLLREFSISQFTYQTIEQYIAIEKEVQRNKRRYNQSYEGFFIDKDGDLDYRNMIETIERIIASGALSINKELDKDRNRQRDLFIEHPQARVYETVKAQANRIVDLQSSSNQINKDGDVEQQELEEILANLEFDNELIYE